MKITLRPITIKDGSHLIKWRNDERVINHCLSRAKITEKSNKEFFENYVQTGKYKQYIVERVNDDFPIVAYPIATVYLKDMDYTNKRCELCIFTSPDEEWRSESQNQAIRMLVEKAFKEFGMHKVYSYVFYKYSDEVELLKDAGFTIEALLKEEACNAEGKYEDIVRMSVVNQD